MFYKLSNTCDLKTIENEFDANFRFPNLYEPKVIISGTEESNLSIITAQDSKRIDYAIWGLLPEDYDDDWDRFQSVTNTLNTNVDDLNLSEEIYSKSLDERRCLIIVNGFFTSNIYKGKLYPFHVHLKNHKPFCIAGIYNKLNDGFLTCSLLVTNFSSNLNEIPHLGKQRPLTFRQSDFEEWLSKDKSKADLERLIHNHNAPDFISHPIKEDFYKNNSVFEDILESDNYSHILKNLHRS
ncbi:SOS response-associated peptidase family protein [Psychroserpens mesophilus]|uniref:SOS response-associated peptidase family protein n=1 Tax=Psychroserpens mesophilus TaxID=325473 RepID=UPI003D65A9B3